MRNIRKIRACSLTAALLGSTSVAMAQDDGRDEIIVVGSGIGVSRDAIESQALPIDLFDQEKLSLSGDITIEDVLRTEPAFQRGNPANDGGGTANDPEVTLDLRGIGDVYTLTLINGRRFGVNGPANVRMVPFRALERIEVLKAGASSVYGSDAVAGVVNLVTKKSDDGAEIWGRTGFAEDGYREYNVDFSIGGEGERFSYFLIGSYSNVQGLLQRDRPATESNNQLARGGFDFRSSSTNPARLRFQDGRDLILNTDRVGPGGIASGPEDYREFDFDRDATDRAAIGRTVWPDVETWSILGSTSYDVTSKTTLTTDFLYHETSIFDLGGGISFDTIVPADQFWNPFGEPVRVSMRPDSPFDVSPDGEPALDNTLSEPDQSNLFVALQLKHDFSDMVSFVADGSFYRKSGAFQNDVTSGLSRPGLERALARPGPDAFNPFCNLCNTDEQQREVWVRTANIRTERLYQFDGRFNFTDIPVLGLELDAVVGGGWRQEEADNEPTDAVRNGTAFFTPAGGEPATFLDRSVSSVFGEVRAPLLDETSPIGALEIGVAARYENFSDVGDTFNPLVSFRWEPLAQQFAMRGSWNTSFRAPFLEQVGGPQQINEVVFINPNTGLPEEGVGVAGANEGLEPEEARTFSVGFIATPEAVPGLFVSLDFWDLKQENLIFLPTAQSVFLGTAPGVLRAPTPGELAFNAEANFTVEALFVNFDERRVQGIDFAVRQAFELANDMDLQFDFAGSYFTNFEINVFGDGPQDIRGTYSEEFGGEGFPKFRSTGGVTLNSGGLTARAQVNYITGYRDNVQGVVRDGVPLATDIDAWLTTDLSLRYNLESTGLDFMRGATVAFGINNLFDRQAPFVPSNNFYDPAVHDIRGRIIHATIGARF